MTTDDQGRVIVFDLDDTLYPEITFVRSGLGAVASVIESSGQATKEAALQVLEEALERGGRGRVFDTAIEELRLKNLSVRSLVSVYRSHRPQISLDRASIPTLRLANDLSRGDVYLVTDGNRLVQRRKVAALELESHFRKIYYTRDYGLAAEKPSCEVFERIQKLSGKSISNFTIVGDDPTKDFECVLSHGGQAIRIRRGRLSGHDSFDRLQAQHQVAEISEVQDKLRDIFISETAS